METGSFVCRGTTLLVPTDGTSVAFDLRSRTLVREPRAEVTPATSASAIAPTCQPQANLTGDVRKAWRGFRSLMLLVSRRCNLECIYCYASALPTGPLMSMRIALDAVEHYFKGNPEHPSIVFHGGGEPTLNMPVIKAVCERARKLAPACSFALTTNGAAPNSVFEYLMQQKFNILLSWDGPPEVQNRNRPFVGGHPSSAHLERTAEFLAARNYPFTVQMTVTSATDVRATIDYFADHGVRSIKLEPLFPHGRDYDARSDHDVPPPTSDDLVSKMVEALDACEARSVRLKSTAFDGDGLPTWHGLTFCGNACGRTMVVTHDGHLTGCNEVADCNDPLSAVFFFGRQSAAENTWSIESPRLAPLLKRHVLRLRECVSCPARFACGGGCAVKAFRVSGSLDGINPANCDYQMKIIPLLIKRAAKKRNI